MIKHAFDISNYSGFLLPQQAEFLRSQVDYMIVRAGPQAGVFNGNTWTYTRQQLLALQDAGMPVTDIYGFVNFRRDAVEQADEWVRLAEGFDAVKGVWLDCEASPPHASGATPINPAQAVEHIGLVRDRIRVLGKLTGIYTAAWWWEPYTANSDAFAGEALWVATNDQAGNIALPRPFGGWTAPYMEQFKLDFFVGNPPFVVDLNAYAVPDPLPPPTYEAGHADGLAEGTAQGRARTKALHEAVLAAAAPYESG